MAIMGFIVVVAGRVFSDSTGMRVRSQNMLASAEEGGRVTALLKEDISQMGTKSFGALIASTYSVGIVESVYIGGANEDSSSYNLGSNYNDLTFRKAHYDENGKCLAAMEIRWYVKDKKLLRTCKILPDSNCPNSASATAGCDEKEVEIASDVAEFNLLPSKPGVDKDAQPLKFPNTNESFSIMLPAQANGTSAVPTNTGGYKLSGFQKNDPNTTQKTYHFYLAQNGDNSGCKKLTFEAGEIYAIELQLHCEGKACSHSGELNKMVMFQPGRDHLSVGLREIAMNGKPIADVPDFLFYPPQNEEANIAKTRHFEFSVPKPATGACVGITAAFYSEAAYNGYLEIENFRVYKTENVYYFPTPPYNPTNGTEKASVKAFQLELKIEKKKETNVVKTIIPVPNNGVVPAKASI
jgi:hypothetical protein